MIHGKSKICAAVQHIENFSGVVKENNLLFNQIIKSWLIFKIILINRLG